MKGYGSATATLVESWNGTAWEVQSSPNPTGAEAASLEAVSCSSSTTCTAVGWYENSSGASLSLAERWNGKAWEIQSTPNPAGAKEVSLGGVSCSSSKACTATGSYQNSAGTSEAAFVEQWNGTEWKVEETPIPSGAGKYDKGTLLGVSCSSPTACTAVGQYESSSALLPLAESWNGSAWKVQSVPAASANNSLYSVSCQSSTVCTAVGEYEGTFAYHALVERWNGTAWELQATPNPTGVEEKLGQPGWGLHDVSCPSSTACTAVGYYRNSSGDLLILGERWNGTAWELVAPINRTGVEYSWLRGVSCTSSTGCTGVGYSENYEGNDIPSITLAERLVIPAAEIEAATSLTTTGATLNGTVNPQSRETTYHFEYGTTTAYGTNVPVPEAKAGAGSSNVKVSHAVTGLKEKVTYHFRLVATSSAGTTNGGDQDRLLRRDIDDVEHAFIGPRVHALSY